jgi:hypothetical protein
MDSTTQIGFARRSRDRPFTLYYKSTSSFLPNNKASLRSLYEHQLVPVGYMYKIPKVETNVNVSMQLIMLISK